MASVVNAKCKECGKDSADQFCFECEHMLCTGCKASHLKRKGTKKHHVEKAYSHLLNQNRRPTCPTHNKEVVFYCDSCCLLICPNCMLENHKDHDVEDIEQAISKKKDVISEEIEKNESKSELIKKLMIDNKSSLDTYMVDNAIVKTKIKGRCELLKTLIDKQAEVLMQKVDKEEAVQKDRNSDHLEKLKDIACLYESQICRLRNSLHLTSGLDLLLSYGDWEEDIDNLKNRKTHIHQAIPPVMFIEPHADNDNRLAELFGKLEKGFR